MLNVQIVKGRKLNPLKFGEGEQGSRRRDGREKEVSHSFLCSFSLVSNTQLVKINIHSC